MTGISGASDGARIRTAVRTRISIGYGVAMTVAGASVFALPRFGAASWAVIGVLSVGATLLGARRHATARPWVWWLLAAALAAMATGDTLYGLAAHAGPDAVPEIADVCYMAMFPLVITALISMVHAGAGLATWSRLLDALTFLCAAGLLAWVVLTAPALGADRLGSGEKSVLAAYNLGDLLILVTTVWLVLAVRRSPALVLLVLGAAGMLGGDLAWTLNELRSGWRPGGVADAAYLCCYAAWGAAALQPSMVDIVAPVPARTDWLRWRWAALLGVSVMVPPVVLVAEALAGQVRDAAIIGVVAGLMAALVMTRLLSALAHHRRALARERTLRHGCAGLLSVLTRHGVHAVVHDTAEALLPGAAHEVLVGLPGTDPSDDAELHLPAPPGRGGYGPGRVLRATVSGGGSGGAVRPRALLRPDLAHRLDRYPSVLTCPLGIESGTGAGVLLIAGHPATLTIVAESATVLAFHATLALERIALTEQLNRRDNDHYLQTITQASREAILIVDDALHVRYASSTVATLVGRDPPVLASLHDLPGDEQQIGRTLAAAGRAADPDGARDWWYLRHADGSPRTVQVTCRDLRQDHTIRGYVISLRDATDDHAHQRDAIQQALDASPAGQNRRSSHHRFG